MVPVDGALLLRLDHGRVLSLPRLNLVLFQLERSLDAVQFPVEAAGVADGIALPVPAPQNSVLGLAVNAGGVGSQASSSVLRYNNSSCFIHSSKNRIIIIIVTYRFLWDLLGEFFCVLLLLCVLFGRATTTCRCCR